MPNNIGPRLKLLAQLHEFLTTELSKLYHETTDVFIQDELAAVLTNHDKLTTVIKTIANIAEGRADQFKDQEVKLLEQLWASKQFLDNRNIGYVPDMDDKDGR